MGTPFKLDKNKFDFGNKGNFNFNKKNDYSKKNTYVDPDAPGTPGTPGYEPPVKREDLDEKGKKIWDSKRKKSGAPNYKKGYYGV